MQTRYKEMDIIPTLTCWYTNNRKTDMDILESFLEGSAYELRGKSRASACFRLDSSHSFKSPRGGGEARTAQG